MFIAPLLVLTLFAGRVRSLQRLLHVSGLADLPILIDIIRGRASFDIGRKPEPGRHVSASASFPSAFATARPETVSVNSPLEVIGRNFRNSFAAAGSSEFDGLLRAIDRAFASKSFAAAGCKLQ